MVCVCVWGYNIRLYFCTYVISTLHVALHLFLPLILPKSQILIHYLILTELHQLGVTQLLDCGIKIQEVSSGVHACGLTTLVRRTCH